MLIDVSFFETGRRRVQNASSADKPSENSLAVNEYIEDYIREYQGTFLEDMLGRSLAEDVEEYLGRDNKEEKDESLEVLCLHLQESFADFVYFQLLRDSERYMTITGMMQLSNDNKYLSPLDMQVSIWNEMCKKNERFLEWAQSPLCSFDVIIKANMLHPINSYNL